VGWLFIGRARTLGDAAPGGAPLAVIEDGKATKVK
jgi:hypothetical protein